LGAVAIADDPRPRSSVSADIPKSNDQSRQPETSIAKRYEQIRAEFDTQQTLYYQSVNKPDVQPETRAVANKKFRHLVVDYCRRMVDLAESSPDEPAARDALLWVLDNAGRGGVRSDRDHFAHASALIVRHHGNDPEAIRFAVAPPNQPVTTRHEALIEGFYAAAKDREAKGLARLALAQYLVNKTKHVVYAQSLEGRPKRRHLNGGKVVAEVDMTDEQYAELLMLRQCDPGAIEGEAQRLFEEVIAEYGDIPYITRRFQELDALLKAPTPTRRGMPLSAAGRRGIEETRARRKKTLGQAAEDGLDSMLNLAVGKPAPEIDGVDLDGKPLKLSDYRGKVVVLVFWGTWCSPCMALVPHERELVARLKGQPFALLGIDCQDDKDAARKVVAEKQMTWPSWFDGPPGGPIASRYHIRSYPAVLVLDAQGIIRSRRQAELDKIVEKLLDEMKKPALESPGVSRTGRM
jgi:thiol-disulfide isomerase/thioredoxin